DGIRDRNVTGVQTCALPISRICSGVLVQTNGCLRSFQPVMNWRILALRSLTDVKTPRRMACRSMIPNQTSTRLSQGPDVGVKCTWNRGCFSSHAFTCGVLWVA